MFEGSKWNWGWPGIIAVVVLVMVLLQVARVNGPRQDAHPTEAPIYSQAGNLVRGPISIPAGEFYQTRLSLNRRAKVSGSFSTPGLVARVAAAVIKESDLEGWKSGAEIKTLSRVGYVPGGKISVVLEPGTYLLLIDNRNNSGQQVVNADFDLE